MASPGAMRRQAGATMARTNVGQSQLRRNQLEDKLDDYELFLDELNDIIAERDSCKEFLQNTEEALERIEDIEIDLGNCKESAKTDEDLASLYYHVLAQLPDFPELNDLRTQVMAKVTKWP